MAVRNLLHINHQAAFEDFLAENGYVPMRLTNPYEVIRMKNLETKDTVVVYKKESAKEHLSLMDKDYPLYQQFMNILKEEKEKPINLHCSNEYVEDLVRSVASLVLTVIELDAGALPALMKAIDAPTTGEEFLDAWVQATDLGYVEKAIAAYMKEEE